MEEARHWVWAKRKHGLIGAESSHDPLDQLNQAPNRSSYDDSWEEQAFAEDAAGPLGGCIWPPRSYSCSFCRREFRSAQALGGHMNVHRRDRARLKLSSPDLHREILHQNRLDHVDNAVEAFQQNVSPLMITASSMGASSNSSKIPQFPSQVCALVYNPNPNSDSRDHNRVLVSSSPPQENVHKESDKRDFLFDPSSQISWSNLGTTGRCYRHGSHQKDLHGDQKESSLTVESGGSCRAKSRDYHHVKTDLSVSLNLVVCRSCPNTLSGGYNIEEDCDHYDHGVSTFKRRRTVSDRGVSISGDNTIQKPSSGDRQDHKDVLQKDGLKQHSPCSNMEELDLELRLGTVRTS